MKLIKYFKALKSILDDKVIEMCDHDLAMAKDGSHTYCKHCGEKHSKYSTLGSISKFANNLAIPMEEELLLSREHDHEYTWGTKNSISVKHLTLTKLYKSGSPYLYDLRLKIDAKSGITFGDHSGPILGQSMPFALVKSDGVEIIRDFFFTESNFSGYTLTTLPPSDDVPSFIYSNRSLYDSRSVRKH